MGIFHSSTVVVVVRKYTFTKQPNFDIGKYAAVCKIFQSSESQDIIKSADKAPMNGCEHGDTAGMFDVQTFSLKNVWVESFKQRFCMHACVCVGVCVCVCVCIYIYIYTIFNHYDCSVWSQVHLH